MGKTSMAINIAQNAAVKNGMTVAVFLWRCKGTAGSEGDAMYGGKS